MSALQVNLRLPSCRGGWRFATDYRESFPWRRRDLLPWAHPWTCNMN